MKDVFTDRAGREGERERETERQRDREGQRERGRQRQEARWPESEIGSEVGDRRRGENKVQLGERYPCSPQTYGLSVKNKSRYPKTGASV